MWAMYFERNYGGGTRTVPAFRRNIGEKNAQAKRIIEIKVSCFVVK